MPAGLVGGQRDDLCRCVPAMVKLSVRGSSGDLSIPLKSPSKGWDIAETDVVPSSSAASAAKGPKLIIFGFDLTGLPPSAQYIVLTLGLFLFTCTYGYYQELVIYSWFRRRLGTFTTMLFFLGNAVCSILEKLLISGTQPLERKSPWRFHIFMSFVKLGAQVLTNMSMAHINYPAKVLFKSSIPVAQMAIGLSCLGKNYPMRDYIVISLLFVGLYTFITGNPQAPDASGYGIFLVTLSMLMAASVPMVQEHCMTKYSSNPTEMLYFSFMGGTGISVVVALCAGEFHKGIAYMWTHDVSLLPESTHHTLHEYKEVESPWFALLMFCTLGYLGAHCSTAITQHFGSLLNGVTNTARKATSLSLSYFMFPDEHALTMQHIIGSFIFFIGLVVRAFGNGHSSKAGKVESEPAVAGGPHGAVYDVDSEAGCPPKGRKPESSVARRDEEGW